MFQELAQQTSAQTWVIGSMLFFIGVFALVAIKVFRTPAAEHQARAQLPLDDPGSDPEQNRSSQR
ncbi:MAG: hypothetical protein DRI90_28745 [Deltaproteobacteria bacterium]|nr:MAG: hypothetical protein DRI90_28745 [Deltaproteobacteria bacterium]